MSEILLFLILGLGTGTMLAGIGLSIVVTFRSSGVVNFSAGAMAMVSAYTYSGLRADGTMIVPPLPNPLVLVAVPLQWFGVDWAMPAIPTTMRLASGPLTPGSALLVALLVAVALGALAHLLVFRPLRNATPLARAIASVGVMLLLQAVVVVRYTSQARTAPSVLPTELTGAVPLLGARVPMDRLILAGVAVVVTALLWALYKYSRFGIATRAAEQNERAAVLAGLPTQRLALYNWMLSAVVAGLLGIMFSPITQLVPDGLTFMVVPALGAALLGGFSSFWVTTAAAFGIGMAQSLITYFSTLSWYPQVGGQPMPGLAAGLPFVLIFVVMLWRGDRIPARIGVELKLPRAPRPQHPLAWGVVFGVIALVAVIWAPPDWRQALILSLIGAVASMSLVVATGFLGQVSLAQSALAGVAAFLLSTLTTTWGVPFPLGPVIAVAGAVVVGVVAGLPALRVRDVNFAVITLAAAVALEQVVFNNPLVGGGLTPAAVAAPRIGDLDLGPAGPFPLGDPGQPSPVFGVFCVLVVAAVAAVVIRLRCSDLGLRMLAVRNNERAAAAAGLDVTRLKVQGFAIAAAIAGVAGVLLGYSAGVVSLATVGALQAIGVLANAYIGGIGSVGGAIMGGLLTADAVMFHFLTTAFGVPPTYYQVLAGVALILSVLGNPDGAAVVLTGVRRRLWSRLSRGRPASAAAVVAPIPSRVGATR